MFLADNHVGRFHHVNLLPIPPIRLPIKKRLMFPGKTLRKTNVKKKKVTPKLEYDAKADKSADKLSSSTQADVPDELEAEKTIRKSTRTSVIVRQAEREAIRAEKEATAKVCTCLQALHRWYQML